MHELTFSQKVAQFCCSSIGLPTFTKDHTIGTSTYWIDRRYLFAIWLIAMNSTTRYGTS